jgi:hypothetical protein
MDQSRTKLAAGLLAGLGAFALIAQFPMSVANVMGEGHSAWFATARFFAYFTIITNIAAMVTMAGIASGRVKDQSWLTAITSYLIILSLVYHFLLSGERNLSGWPFFVDALLHYVIPAATLIAWVFVFPKRGLTWSQPLIWLVYPMGYLVSCMARGAVENWYPYFFLDVAKFGFGQVALNAVGLAVIFVLSGLALVGVSKLIRDEPAQA